MTFASHLLGRWTSQLWFFWALYLQRRWQIKSAPLTIYVPVQSHLLETDLGLQDKFCDANELEQAWNNITIPEPVLTFLSSLCNVNKTHIQGSDLLSDQAEGDGELPDSDTTTLSQAKMRKVMALFQIKPGYSHGWIYLKKNPFLQPVIPNQYHHGVRSIPLLLRKTSQERLLGSYF